MREYKEQEYDFISIKEISEKLKITRKTVEKWIATGSLKSSKFGRLVRIKTSDFEKFCDSQSRAS